MKKNLISIKDLSAHEIETIFEVTARVKKDKSIFHDCLKGKTVGMIFQKPSNRTRVSFDVGINQLGGHCIYLGPDEINLGVRETTYDVAKTLSRYVDCVVARVFKHDDIVELAQHASVPVINGLSDLDHPCQGLTDIFSIKEKYGDLKGLTLAYVGDGNNVANSLIIGCAKMGINVNVATPKGYEPLPEVIKTTHGIALETGIKLSISNDPKDAIQYADVVYTDTWVSMGQEEETKKRLSDFSGFQINNTLVNDAKKKFIFMHCLPAHRGQEVSNEIIDGQHSIVFDQAENRLHTQKAILIFLMEQK